VKNMHFFGIGIIAALVLSLIMCAGIMLSQDKAPTLAPDKVKSILMAQRDLINLGAQISQLQSQQQQLQTQYQGLIKEAEVPGYTLNPMTLDYTAPPKAPDQPTKK